MPAWKCPHDDVRFTAIACCTALFAIAGFGHDLHVGLTVDQQLEAVPHGHVVVPREEIRSGAPFSGMFRPPRRVAGIGTPSVRDVCCPDRPPIRSAGVAPT